MRSIPHQGDAAIAPTCIAPPATMPRLWGMQLAPLPPAWRSQPTRKPSHGSKNHAPALQENQTKRHLAAPPRGMALMLVLTLLVMTTTIVLELQFDTRVQLQMAANSRNALQAEYLARSSLEFTQLLLSFNSQFTQLKSNPQLQIFLKSAPPEIQMLLNRLQIWKIVPVNSELLKQIAGGAFGRAEPDSAKKDKGETQGKLYPFGDFMGSFSAVLSDESSKINLNLFRNMNDALLLRQQIFALFAPERYNPLFEQRRADGNFVTREEQIAAIQDWVDRDVNVEGQSSSDEDSKYRYPDRGYHSKNAEFYSLEELRLVYGVDDIFYQTFSPFFTVFGRNNINIAEAPKEVLASLVETFATIKPQERVIFRTPVFEQFMQAMVLYRSYLGFPDAQSFVRWCATPTIIDPRLFGGAQNQQMIFQDSLPKFVIDTHRMNQVITLSSDANTFRIEASGQVGTVKRTIIAVIYVNNPPSARRDIIYWRLH